MIYPDSWCVDLDGLLALIDWLLADQLDRWFTDYLVGRFVGSCACLVTVNNVLVGQFVYSTTGLSLRVLKEFTACFTFS